MSEQKPPQTADDSQVEVTDPQSMARWCAELRCSETELRLAVRTVGPFVFEVKKHFGR